MTKELPKRKCPFCAEEIQADAKKCKHCGEWLIKSPQNIFHSVGDSSTTARAVTKGIKEKEAQQVRGGCLGVIAIFIAVFIGVYAGWYLGVISFLVLFIPIAIWYYKE